MRKVEVSMRRKAKNDKKGGRKSTRRHSEKSLKGEIFQTNFYYSGTYFEKELLQKSGRLDHIFTLDKRDAQSIGKLMGIEE